LIVRECVSPDLDDSFVVAGNELSCRVSVGEGVCDSTSMEEDEDEF
jgi:hypothetical protein